MAEPISLKKEIRPRMTLAETIYLTDLLEKVLFLAKEQRDNTEDFDKRFMVNKQVLALKGLHKRFKRIVEGATQGRKPVIISEKIALASLIKTE